MSIFEDPNPCTECRNSLGSLGGNGSDAGTTVSTKPSLKLGEGSNAAESLTGLALHTFGGNADITSSKSSFLLVDSGGDAGTSVSSDVASWSAVRQLSGDNPDPTLSAPCSLLAAIIAGATISSDLNRVLSSLFPQSTIGGLFGLSTCRLHCGRLFSPSQSFFCSKFKGGPVYHSKKLHRPCPSFSMHTKYWQPASSPSCTVMSRPFPARQSQMGYWSEGSA